MNLNRLQELLRIARNAAKKLESAYIRSEISPRSEYDALIGIGDELQDFFVQVKRSRVLPNDKGCEHQNHHPVYRPPYTDVPSGIVCEGKK
jgi:hypothetical protein